MLSILKRYELVFIAQQVGLDYLTEADKAILLAAGINLDSFKNEKGIVEHAFLFGLLSEAIGSKRAKGMKYAQFKKFIASKNFVPLTEEEEFALKQLKNRAYTDITSLGDRMRTRTSNIIIRANNQQRKMVEQIVKKQAIKSVELRMGARSLAANIGNATQDWERDWLRIAYYLLHEAFNTGRAESIYRKFGPDAEVYFDVYPGACTHCRELYLEDPEDLDSKPKVFKLSTLIENGNNIGRKAADWLPTIAPTHPYCRCTLNYKRPGYEWDAKLRAFTKPIKKKLNPKLGIKKLDIKVSIK